MFGFLENAAQHRLLSYPKKTIYKQSRISWQITFYGFLKNTPLHGLLEVV